jgi:catechol 2,3-dioxygenase
MRRAGTVHAAGLFHAAILYPTRKNLATIVKRLLDAAYRLTRAADHGVSQAIYLNDPDGNGVELYWDRPREDWPFDKDGALLMGTDSLDLNGLLSELNN